MELGQTITPEAPPAAPEPAGPVAPPRPSVAPSVRVGLSARSTVEFLIILFMGILFARAFAAEAYIVPTGSMAPTLLGMHRDFVCPNCGKRFSLGMDEDGRLGRPVCPNCGQTELAEAPASDGLGDRLLVQKFVYDLRPPRRWEVAVFQNPADPSQAYVKRVVALPGEAIQLAGGDVYIDGRIARKTLAEARAMSVPVYDHDFTPKDLGRFPRFSFRRGEFRRIIPSGWKAEGSRFVREPTGQVSDLPDWISYRHWQADRANYGPIRDFIAYNGSDIAGENRVRDLILTTRLVLGEGCSAVTVRIDSGADRFLITLPITGPAPIEVRRNGRFVPTEPLGPSLGKPAKGPRTLEVAVVDHRLTVAIDGSPAFEPVDYDDPHDGPPGGPGPVALGVIGDGRAEVLSWKLDRDVYYTAALAQSPRRPFAVEEPYVLGRDQYFVLGDNSPVSNDSRFWPDSPVVTLDRFLGKPFLVHLPSQAVPLQVFGRSLYWIPDPREIRYIR